MAIRSAFSYPGVPEPTASEAVAVYEGIEMQEVYADLEDNDVVVQ
jgi:hypothetical protein